ncbi:hypothetical protein [Halostagnicola sp. A-GB9-2]|nr:hypothetical protein [Halostagnicola sp. A-GB9-2]MDJ1433344.1 hypothetical protein [Halostagnicola sp. A-GB9-2]
MSNDYEDVEKTEHPIYRFRSMDGTDWRDPQWAILEIDQHVD